MNVGVRVTAIVTAGAMLAGCGKTVDGAAHNGSQAPTATSSAAPPTDNSLAAILPDSAQWSAALGYPVHTEGYTPRVGGVEQLLNQDSLGEWSTRECVGVVLPALKSVYGSAPVRAVTASTVADVTVGAVELASAADAQSLFQSFAGQWQQCEGKTVVQKNTYDSFSQQITGVTATDNVLSANITGTVPPKPPMPIERALGVAGSCIVDVSAQGNPQPANPPGSSDNVAVSLVKLMQSKAAAAKC